MYVVPCNVNAFVVATIFRCHFSHWATCSVCFVRVLIIWIFFFAGIFVRSDYLMTCMFAALWTIFFFFFFFKRCRWFQFTSVKQAKPFLVICARGVVIARTVAKLILFIYTSEYMQLHPKWLQCYIYRALFVQLGRTRVFDSHWFAEKRSRKLSQKE